MVRGGVLGYFVQFSFVMQRRGPNAQGAFAYMLAVRENFPGRDAAKRTAKGGSVRDAG